MYFSEGYLGKVVINQIVFEAMKCWIVEEGREKLDAMLTEGGTSFHHNFLRIYRLTSASLAR